MSELLILHLYSQNIYSWEQTCLDLAWPFQESQIWHLKADLPVYSDPVSRDWQEKSVWFPAFQAGQNVLLWGSVGKQRTKCRILTPSRECNLRVNHLQDKRDQVFPCLVNRNPRGQYGGHTMDERDICHDADEWPEMKREKWRLFRWLEAFVTHLYWAN